ncbi:MAG: gliding motility-associated C-terminal domain-containing protein [Bacteroidales bacterium]|nr:gliding motility-associated C-terminal domain-containing protein [Bacteroidales bacterium]
MQRKSLYFIILVFILMIISIPGYSTHNRAGEILYEHISGYKYKLIIYTYCYTLTEADRDELPLNCGDGTDPEILPRISKTYLDDGSNFGIANLCKNVYIGEHTFSGPGVYELYMEDPNRNEGVLNIPNSVNTYFALKTILTISSVVGNNSSPILLNAPMDMAALNKKFIHNPGAWDPDGDSLSYKISTCLSENGKEIVGYTLPPVTNEIYVDPYTGDFVWDAPSKVGTYNAAMTIEEWRNGVLISTILRDIQVEVIDTDNHTPIIDNIANHCVVADSCLEFKVTAWDNDIKDKVQLTASGGVFELENSPATFYTPNNWASNQIGYFRWQTIKDHVQRMPYEVLFRAVDNDVLVPLTDYRKAKITVIAPPPIITSISPTNSSIKLTWNNGGNDKASGYKIYRTKRLDNYQPGICETGLPAESGYELIKTINDINDTIFIDDNNGIGLATGFRYCYRITAIFPDGAESQVSENACSLLSRGTIIFTKATVNQTDKDNGEIYLEWTTPKDLDKSVVLPPYAYLLYPSLGIYDGIYTNPFEINGIEDTTFTHSNIDTYSKGSIYKITFTNRNQETGAWNSVGSASMASTVFLKLSCESQSIRLSYEADVPWQNDTFVIYRRDPGKMDFDSVGFSTDGTYLDKNLENDVEYCYKIKTIGFYSEEGLPTHIENWSQIACGTPIDTIPPRVKLNLQSLCSDAINKLEWYPDTIFGLDVAKYHVFYSETMDGSLEKIADLEPEILSYEHHPTKGMAGCYVVTATDLSGNSSDLESQLRSCIDACDYYRLPNVFTPNGDGKNDIFHPYPYQFIDHIDMTITNRWGHVVYTTNDPDINWDGTDKNSGQIVPDGVYFYRCTVYEHRLSGLEERNLEGYITIFTNKTDE